MIGTRKAIVAVLAVLFCSGAALAEGKTVLTSKASGKGLTFTKMGQFPGGGTFVMAMKGNILFTATGPLVEVWNVKAGGTLPKNYMTWKGTNEIVPEKIGEISFEDYNIGGLEIAGDRLYVGNQKGLAIVDISSPGSPKVITTYYKEPYGHLKVKDKRLYASTDSYGGQYKGTHKFVILDVSEPDKTRKLGEFKIPIKKGTLERFAVSGNHAYLPLYNNIKPGYVFVVDVSNPARPREVARIEGDKKSVSGFSAVEVDEKRNILFAFEYRYCLRAYDISNPASPKELGRVTNKEVNSLKLASDMDIRGDYAYFSAFYQGVTTVNISDPAKMTLAGKGSGGRRFGYVHDILLNGDYAYVTGMGAGFTIFNVSKPSNPSCVIMFNTHGIFYHVGVKDNHAYVAADYEFMVLDVSKKKDSEKREMKHIASVEWARSGIGGIKDNYVFVDMGWRPLAVFNVADPKKPKLVKQYSHHTNVGPIVGGTMYIGRGAAGSQLHILDISKLPDIRLRSKRVLSKKWPYAPTIAVKGNYLYAGPGTAGLKVLDISNPGDIKETGSLMPGLRAQGLVVRGDYLYVRGDYALLTFDISDPKNPKKTHEVKHGLHMGGAYGVNEFTAWNNYLASSSHQGLVLWNISNPSKPGPPQAHPLPAESPGRIGGFCFAGGLLYVALPYKGVYCFRVEEGKQN